MNSPCLNCKDRKVSCHSKCDKYKKYFKKNEEIKKKATDLADITSYEYLAVMRMKGRRGYV